MKNVRYSAIICTCNRAEELSAAIESLFLQTRPPDEILVVDASDTPSVRELMEKLQVSVPPVSLRYISSKRGLTLQRNLGAREATGNLVGYFDDDVVLDTDYLENLLICFTDERVGGAMGVDSQARKGGLPGRLFRRFFMLPRMDGDGWLQPSGMPAWKIDPGKILEVGMLRGHNMTYRREVLDRLRFNERFEGYGLMEDVEFSARVAAEWKLLMTHQAHLAHKKSPSVRDPGGKIFEMRAFHHGLLYRSCIKRTGYSRFCFEWARVGVFLWALLSGLRQGSMAAVRGAWRGYGRLRGLPEKGEAR